MKTYDNIVAHLGDKASFYLDHVSQKVTKDELQLPDKNIVDNVFGVREGRKRALCSIP
ncbi:hypothetical protein [Muricauda sp. MAR_2010_75]|uniref:hypothetical protein n=1 Tax=Allomuricauda sp. MAR_2010_75 TaxID=1250232 RepID=UPI0012E04ADA|nr:hypothetical protein [Muricauda sp. MAR_2010_75]